MPERVQLSRVKGWRMPPNTVKVDRTTKWGNPYRVMLDQMRWDGETEDEQGNPIEHGPWLCKMPGGNHLAGFWLPTRELAIVKAVELFRWRMTEPYIASPVKDCLPELRGKDLACWCPLVDEKGQRVPCHADVLLELANK